MLVIEDESGRALGQRMARHRQALRVLALAGLLLLGLFAPAAALELPQDEAAFEAYFDANERDFLQRLGDYNDTYRLAPNKGGPTKVANLTWKFHEVRGDSLFLIIYFDSSTEWWHAQSYRGLFELKDQAGRLAIVGKRPVGQQPRRARTWSGSAAPTQQTGRFPVRSTSVAVSWFTPDRSIGGASESAASIAGRPEATTLFGVASSAHTQGLVVLLQRAKCLGSDLDSSLCCVPISLSGEASWG